MIWGLLALLSALNAGAQTTAATTVLVTAFEPFAGSAWNNSADVLRELEQLSQQDPEPTPHIEGLVLPVVYDRAATVALNHVNKMTAEGRKPALVISLGEAYCEKLRMETLAHNWDQAGIPDNAFQVRSGSVIYADLQPMAALALSYPVYKMILALSPEIKLQTVLSRDAGNFVCNNTAMHMAYELRGERAIPYGFIHVPNAYCEPAVKNPRVLAIEIRRMLKAAVAP